MYQMEELADHNRHLHSNYAYGILKAFALLEKHVYMGTVPVEDVADRRRRNKQAHKSRMINLHQRKGKR